MVEKHSYVVGCEHDDHRHAADELVGERGSNRRRTDRTRSLVTGRLQLPNTEGDLSLEELDTAELLPEDTPEIVSSENIQAKGHVNRLWEQENDLNTIVFQNRDGTKTAYHYSDPVKYTDKNGKVKDKKNKLSETANGEYTNAENDINTYFPKKLHKNKGVELRFDEYTIEMAPNINGSSEASRQTGHDKDSDPTEYVEYPNVFANGVSVRYTPSFGGYKEDIILNENVGKNRFEFKLTTNGLSLVRAETGNYYLAEPLTGEYITALGNVVVYDHTGVESEGYNHCYEVTTLAADEQYLITVVVDERYLESEDTEYPVYVDPTLTVMPQGEVQDAAIYSKGSTYGVGRTLMKFPGLSSNSTYKNLKAEQITNLQLHIYEGSGSTNNACIDLWQYTGTSWTESTARCNNVGWDSYSNNFTWNYINCSGWQTFNLTSMVATWKSGGTGVGSPLDKGIIMTNYTSEYSSAYSKHFMSTESSYKPYLTFTYTNLPTTETSGITDGASYYVQNEYSALHMDI